MDEDRVNPLGNLGLMGVMGLIEGHAPCCATALFEQARQVASRLPRAQMDQIPRPAGRRGKDQGGQIGHGSGCRLNLPKARPMGCLGRSIANGKDREIGHGRNKPLRAKSLNRRLACKGQRPRTLQIIQGHSDSLRLDQGLDDRFMAPLDQPLGGGGGLRLSAGDPDAQPLDLVFRQQQAISAGRLNQKPHSVAEVANGLQSLGIVAETGQIERALLPETLFAHRRQGLHR